MSLCLIYKLVKNTSMFYTSWKIVLHRCIDVAILYHILRHPVRQYREVDSPSTLNNEIVLNCEIFFLLVQNTLLPSASFQDGSFCHGVQHSCHSFLSIFWHFFSSRLCMVHHCNQVLILFLPFYHLTNPLPCYFLRFKFYCWLFFNSWAIS